MTDSPVNETESGNLPFFNGLLGTAVGPLLSVEIPESLFVKHEWVEEEKPYRESMIPATAVNAHIDSLQPVAECEGCDALGHGIESGAWTCADCTRPSR